MDTSYMPIRRLCIIVGQCVT